MSLELSEQDEEFDTVGFNGAVQALSNVDTLEAIQKAANDLTKSDISLCFTKLGVNEHILYFVIDNKEDVPRENREELGRRLNKILEFGAVTVLKKEPSSNMSSYSRLVLISRDTHAEVERYLKEYSYYLQRKLLNGSTSFKEKAPLVEERKSDAHACKTLGLMPDAQPPEKKLRVEAEATLPETPSPKK